MPGADCAACPSTLLIVRGRRLRPGGDPGAECSVRRNRRYTGEAVDSVDAERD